jgi:cobalt-precorrin 5A hydrolase
MGMGEVMIVAGVGCRKGATAVQIEAAIAAALARAGRDMAAVRIVATAAAKGDERGIAAAASSIGVPLILVAPDDLAAAGARATTRSQRVLALVGVPSVAEAAALAVGGPAARLIAPRIAVGPATCALADCAGEPREAPPSPCISSAPAPARPI